MLKVEAQVEEVHHLPSLRQQVRNDFRRVRRARDFVISAEIDLVAIQHQHFRIESLRGLRVVFVRYVQFHRVVNARFTEVPKRQVFHLRAAVDLTCLRCSDPLEPTDLHWLAHSPPVKVVGLKIDEELGWASGVECRDVGGVGLSVPSRNHRHRNTDHRVNHRKHLWIRDEDQHAVGVAQPRVSAQMR